MFDGVTGHCIGLISIRTLLPDAMSDDIDRRDCWTLLLDSAGFGAWLYCIVSAVGVARRYILRPLLTDVVSLLLVDLVGRCSFDGVAVRMLWTLSDDGVDRR